MYVYNVYSIPILCMMNKQINKQTVTVNRITTNIFFKYYIYIMANSKKNALSNMLTIITHFVPLRKDNVTQFLLS